MYLCPPFYMYCTCIVQYMIFPHLHKPELHAVPEIYALNLDSLNGYRGSSSFRNHICFFFLVGTCSTHICFA